jgi:hypothetical protein
MPLQLPNLDDRRYADLVEEAKGLIPTYAPEWTNHNPSDPGITLIELFAYLSEMLIYRLNRVTPRNKVSFLWLLNGAKWNPFKNEPGKENLNQQGVIEQLKQLSAEQLAHLVASELPQAILDIRKLERAISCADFETLALEADPSIARAHCLPRRSATVSFELEREGNVSLIVLPKENEAPNLSAIIEKVKQYLDPRLLVTTKLHVVRPEYAEAGIKVTVVPMPDQNTDDAERKKKLRESIAASIRGYFSEFPDEQGGGGWPFGRNVFISEIYALLDRLETVDYVVAVSVAAAASESSREIRNKNGELIGIEVKPYELVKANITENDVTLAKK